MTTVALVDVYAYTCCHRDMLDRLNRDRRCVCVKSYYSLLQSYSVIA